MSVNHIQFSNHIIESLMSWRICLMLWMLMAVIYLFRLAPLDKTEVKSWRSGSFDIKINFHVCIYSLSISIYDSLSFYICHILCIPNLLFLEIFHTHSFTRLPYCVVSSFIIPCWLYKVQEGKKSIHTLLSKKLFKSIREIMD